MKVVSNWWLTLLAVIFVLFTSTGCNTVDGSERYKVATIGNAKRSVEAIVLPARPVFVLPETTGAGASLGGAIGGGVALNNSNNVGIIFAGIIAGAIVGDTVERSAGTRKAHEYLIQTLNGALLTVVQTDEGNSIFSKESKVILIHGYPSELIADPR